MPIVNFLTTKHAPEGSEERNAVFLCAHIGFFFFNLVNVGYILFYQGYAYGKLRTNRLMPIAIAACATQALSCSTSIHRYNINDEYGPFALYGTALGLFAALFMNINYLFILFNKTVTAKKIGVGTILWMLLFVPCMALSLRDWETKRFAYFQVAIAASTAYSIICIYFGMVAHKNGDIRIDSSILSYDQMNNLFRVSILLTTLVLVCGGLFAYPMLLYPGTGLTYSVMVILVSYVGQMDFMTEGYVQVDEGTSFQGGGDTTPNYSSVA